MIDTDKYEEKLEHRMDKEFCNDIACGDMNKDLAIQYAHEFYGNALELLAEVKRFRRMCLNDMVCYDCLSDLYKAGLSDENPVDAYWCGMCCEPMKGLVE